MRVLILGAQTGQGHASVLHAIKDSLSKKTLDIDSHVSFYEELYESNQVLSNLYNIVQARSMKLGVMLNEIMVTEGRQQQERAYFLWLPKLKEVFREQYDAVISVTPLINYALTRYFCDELRENAPQFYIVVTDPYKPIYPGFAQLGAKRYFCPTQISKEQLVAKEISEEQIVLTGYPLGKKYFSNSIDKEPIRRKYGICSNRVLLINCGAGGSLVFRDIVDEILGNCLENLHILVVCGRNKLLYSIMQDSARRVSNKDITVLQYVDNMHELFTISDISIMKAGANSVFEAMKCGCFPLIAGFEGLFYQERGVYDYLSNLFGFEQKASSTEDLLKLLHKVISFPLMRSVQDIMKNMTFPDAAEDIAERIQKDLLSVGHEIQK